MPSPSPFLLVAGARPNFMKVAPIAREMKRLKVPYRLLNTGQHHDPSLSSIFLKQLGLGQPHYNLEVGSGTHAQTTSRVMEKAEPILMKLKPRAVIVVGDVNSTLALTLAAVKLNLPVAHVEAGLRSRDRTMPEEVNRILTDVVSDLLLTPSPDADLHLLQEGVARSKIKRVGNVMIDSLIHALQQVRNQRDARIRKSPYFLMTFHRPSNVDTFSGLKKLISFLGKASRLLPVYLPLHPRTRVQLEKFKLWNRLQLNSQLKILHPLPYFEFVQQMKHAAAVVTDSGGVQEETTYLGVPCLIMRTTTERPICCDKGTAELMGEDFNQTLSRLELFARGVRKKTCRIPLWDGHAARRIVQALTRRY